MVLTLAMLFEITFMPLLNVFMPVAPINNDEFMLCLLSGGNNFPLPGNDAPNGKTFLL